MPKIIKSLLALFVKMALLLPFAAHAQKTDSAAITKKLLTSKPLPVFIKPAAPLPQNFYAAHLPLFCNTELKVAKVTKIPIKFRLGSLADCNKLEGKQ